MPASRASLPYANPLVYNETACDYLDFLQQTSDFLPPDAIPSLRPVTAEHIILIGAMGVGKSSVGRKLAKKLNRPFYDSDQVIEEKTGVDIATIFEYEGEAGFRLREAKAIEELCRRQAMVLATGGGAVLAAPSRTLLTTHGTVIYLKASLDMLLKRTRHSDHRPLLNVPDKRQAFAELLEQREPLYLQTADHTIDTDRRTVSWTANRILQLLGLTTES